MPRLFRRLFRRRRNITIAASFADCCFFEGVVGDGETDDGPAIQRAINKYLGA